MRRRADGELPQGRGTILFVYYCCDPQIFSPVPHIAHTLSTLSSFCTSSEIVVSLVRPFQSRGGAATPHAVQDVGDPSRPTSLSQDIQYDTFRRKYRENVVIPCDQVVFYISQMYATEAKTES